MRKDMRAQSSYGELVGTDIRTFDEAAQSLEVHYTARESFTNRIGTVSGGMLSAMLDSVTGLTALAALPEGVMAAHTALNVEYVRPARPGTIVARGTVLEMGDHEIRTRGVLNDARGRTLAQGQATLRVLRPKAER